jgi:hypothetical protein
MIVLNFDFCYNIIKQIMFYTLGKIKIHLNPFHYINAFTLNIYKIYET